MSDCRCPRCLVIGRPKPLTQKQARAMVERFMAQVKIVHEKPLDIDGSES